MAKPIKSTQALPLRDQVGLRLLGYMLNGGSAPGDPEEAIDRCYAYGDAFLRRARRHWREARGLVDTADDAEANGDAE